MDFRLGPQILGAVLDVARVELRRVDNCRPFAPGPGPGGAPGARGHGRGRRRGGAGQRPARGGAGG
ncbi:MAG: hypothetical protein F4213_09245, partial [Boseongicola sp. SB0677_bin_26]|nr:hypothetical protein [Boseongicola sp. SB0677_bin_26]